MSYTLDEFAPYLPPPMTEAVLRRAYVESGRSIKDIAELAGLHYGARYTPSHVEKWLDHYHIPRRTRGESTRLSNIRRAKVKAATRETQP